MPRRRVEPEILEVAIRLFGLYGFRGVTMKDLAKEARVFEVSIYTWFKNKDLLYLKAVTTVVNLVNQEFHKFLVATVGKSPELGLKRLQDALRNWYRSIPEPAARLLLQVIISDDKLSKTVREPLGQLANAIADVLDRQKKASRKFNSQTAARTLIRALLLARVENDNAPDSEQDMNDVLQQWVLVLEAR